MEKFLKDIRIFFVWIIEMIVKTLKIIDIDEIITGAAITLIIGFLASIGVKHFKK